MGQRDQKNRALKASLAERDRANECLLESLAEAQARVGRQCDCCHPSTSTGAQPMARLLPPLPSLIPSMCLAPQTLLAMELWLQPLPEGLT